MEHACEDRLIVSVDTNFRIAHHPSVTEENVPVQPYTFSH